MIADARTRRRREADAVHAVELRLARAERAQRTTAGESAGSGGPRTA